jgi:hypothetical protein
MGVVMERWCPTQQMLGVFLRRILVKKLLLIGTIVLLTATSASAQSSIGAGGGMAGGMTGGFRSGGSFGNFGSYAPRPPAQRVRGAPNGRGCDLLCQSKCQASWRALGFRSVNACVVRWHRLNAEGTAASCETAIKANGMRPVRGC